MLDDENTDPQKQYCASCGKALQPGAQFCAECGNAAAERRKPASTTTPTSSRAIGYAVLAIFIVAGAFMVYSTTREKQQSARAVPGGPSAAPAAATGAANLPTGHPKIALPQEVLEFLETLEQATKESPEDLAAWQRLARARYRASLIDRSYAPAAIEALDRVVELDPGNLEALRTYGNIAYDGGNYAEAKTYFEEYLELDPADPGVKTDLGSTVLFLGDRESAKRIYREIIEANPDFPQAHVNLGIALYSDGETEEGMASLKRARELVTSDEQRAQIDRVIAAASGQTPPGHPSGGPATANAGTGAPAGQALRPAPSNAQTSFQTEADKVFLAHSIVGPRVAEIDWTGNSVAVVSLRDFPMDKMPPVMLNKFKSKMNESLSRLAEAHDVDEEISIELVDSASSNTMETLDGKEWVGAFDEENYQ
jgi:tetratricopeptide (TPR) repeat protein